jgi:hypothetical protein
MLAHSNGRGNDAEALRRTCRLEHGFQRQLARFRNLDRARVIRKACGFQHHNARARRKLQVRRRIAVEFPVNEYLRRIHIGRNRQIAESF